VISALSFLHFNNKYVLFFSGMDKEEPSFLPLINAGFNKVRRYFELG
jgi:hypothetical protein